MDCCKQKTTKNIFKRPKNNKNNSKLKIRNYKILVLILVIVLVLSLGVSVALIKEFTSKGNPNNLSGSLIKTVSAQEIYPLFICPCCGKTIDTECCSMAKERKEYVNYLVQTKSSKDEIVLSYIKKYGLDSFKDKDKKEEFRRKLVKEAPADRPIITINPVSYDLGDISQQKGVATTFFEIKNEGKSDLIIDRLDSSCGCTSAAIVYRGQEGPRFYMAGHGKENPTNWQITIPPGQTAQLKVYYDPNFHKDFRGSAIREISVFSNDPIDFEKKVQIELNQVD